MVKTTMVNVMFMITMSMMHKNDDDDNADDAQLDFGSKMTGSCFFVAKCAATQTSQYWT